MALSISAGYREVWESVLDEREGYAGGGGSGGGVRWLQHTPDQVDLLLEIKGGSGSSAGTGSSGGGGVLVRHCRLGVGSYRE